MKYFLLLLLLTSCVDQSLYNSPIIPVIDRGPPARGYAKGINWRCSEEDINEKLVWIECKFFNFSYAKTERMCIQIGYNSGTKEVIHSRKVCTPTLVPDENYTNYAAFIKEKRNYLTERCGPELDRCYMTTQETTAE